MGKEAPASYIYEDDHAIAFLNISPLNEGCSLVTSRKHYGTISDVPDKEVAHLFTIVKKVTMAVKRAVCAEGITICQQNGRLRVRVFSLHIQVIPRYEGQRPRRFEDIPETGGEKLDETAKGTRKYL